MDDKVKLASFIAGFTHDPLNFVLACFPWGKGELAEYTGPDEWQREVLSAVGKGVINLKKAFRIAVASGNGIGKAQRLESTIDTPFGKKLWGNLQVGDYVFGADGKPVKIIATRSYKDIPFFRVKFNDGTYCDVSSGHLWTVKGRNERRTGTDYVTLSTLDILEKGVTRKAGSNPKAKQWEIPAQAPVEYAPQELAIHPYLLGVWIGDGTRRDNTYTKPYQEITDHLRELGYQTSEKLSQGKTVRVYNTKHLFPIDLFAKYSHERYIPDVYKYSSVEQRKELLCGLMDTDGEVNKNGSLIYSTTSLRLAIDLLWLIRSLGGIARMQPKNKQGWYYDKDGEKVQCKECYRITFTLPFNPFRLQHRKDRYKAWDSLEHRYKVRYIESIEPIGDMDGMCITVDDESGLYLANDFIVTHNSSLVSWLILWAISTHEDTRGVITANTETQLRSKTWAELAKWYRLFLGNALFSYTATAIFSNQKGHDKTWRIDAVPWSKENPEAFAGLHNHGKRILIVFDEASAIFDEIWRVTEGAVTDSNTEIVWAAFGNPTRNSGKFYECFSNPNSSWQTKQIDSRTVKISNKETLRAWQNEYGEDSDFFKVHVRGLFPDSSVNQLISMELARQGFERTCEPSQYDFAPAIIGVDPAWSGDDSLAIVLRQGIFSKVLDVTPKNDNDMAVARKIALFQDEYNAQAVFIDMGYGTGIYSAGKDMGRHNWKIVAFGSTSDSIEYANKRAEMWFEMRNWLKEGGVIDNAKLRDELVVPEAYINKVGKHQLESKQEMKRRGEKSPNIADALALTFAFPVLTNKFGKYAQLKEKGKLPKWGAM